MSSQNPFAGYKIFEFVLPEDRFSGYVLTTATKKEFTKVVKEYLGKKREYAPAAVSAILRKGGYEALELKIGILSFEGPSDEDDRKFKPVPVFDKYRAFEVYVEREPGQQAWETFRGILTTDCPVARLRELVAQYAKAHKSRERADIQSFLQAEGFYASFQSIWWVIL